MRNLTNVGEGASMSEDAEIVPGILLGLWAGLLFVFGLEAFKRYSGITELYYCLIIVSVSVTALLATYFANQKTKYTRRILLGSWLTLFLLYGLYEVQHTLSWSWGMLLGWVVVALIIAPVLLVVARKPVTGFRAITLTIFAGFVIVLANYVPELLGAIYSFPMVDQIAAYEHSRNWFNSTFGWFIGHDWVRLITYTSFGFMIARRGGLRLGILGSILVACVDSIIGWLVIIPYAVTNSIWDDLMFFWPDILRALVIQACILAWFGLMGILINIVVTQVRWPKLLPVSSDSTIG